MMNLSSQRGRGSIQRSRCSGAKDQQGLQIGVSVARYVTLEEFLDVPRENFLQNYRTNENKK